MSHKDETPGDTGHTGGDAAGAADGDGDVVGGANGEDQKVFGPDAYSSSGRLRKDLYEAELERLQIELVKLQEWVRAEGLRVVVLFEGRDAAGKGGVITRIAAATNPRVVRVVALGTPSDRERTQWYFQRYAAELPAAGEVVLFDRSWYNRAGVERVMGFATPDEVEEFMRSVPQFEGMLQRDGIILVKYWFSVSDEEQERRFQARMDNPLKRWKLSPMDLESRAPMGGVLLRQGRDVRLHRHQAEPVVGGGRRGQALRPPELHQPSAVDDSVRGRHPGSHEAARPSGADRQAHASADGTPDIRSCSLLRMARAAGRSPRPAPGDPR